MALVRTTAGILVFSGWAAWTGAIAAQTPSSSTMAREVASLMAERKLDTFAIQVAGAARFMASLLIPNVQLLVVSAEYPAPDELRAELARMNYRNVYTALHQPASTPTRFFLIDLACDGLSAGGGTVDILYDKGTTQTFFNGDWKAQGLTEAVYRKRVEEAERQYSEVLHQLKEALKGSPSGA